MINFNRLFVAALLKVLFLKVLIERDLTEYLGGLEKEARLH